MVVRALDCRQLITKLIPIHGIIDLEPFGYEPMHLP